MSKRRLNRQQQRRVKNNQAAIVNNEQFTGSDEKGLVICRHAKHADIEDEDGKHIRAKLRQNLGSLTAGDNIIFRRTAEGEAVVLAKLERTSVIGRPDKKGEIKPVAANVSQMLIVFAPKPIYSSLLIDSYLVAANTLNIVPVLIYNKCEISPLPQALNLYVELGYELMATSTKSFEGITHLQNELNDKISVFVGQSGVGKSSLIKALIPEVSPKTNSISKSLEQGMHTTSNSTLYHLPSGGSIIDSPGIREFSLWHLDTTQIIRGFVEFSPLLGQCKYRNCTHLYESCCAFKIAVDENEASKERLLSLQHLLKHTTI